MDAFMTGWLGDIVVRLGGADIYLGGAARISGVAGQSRRRTDVFRKHTFTGSSGTKRDRKQVDETCEAADGPGNSGWRADSADCWIVVVAGDERAQLTSGDR